MSVILKGSFPVKQFKSGTPQYFLTSSSYNITEGQSFTVTLNTGLIPNGTVVPYTITGVSSSDINGESLTGSFVINNGTASRVFTSTQDLNSENETFVLTLNNSLSSVSVVFTDYVPVYSFNTGSSTRLFPAGSNTSWPTGNSVMKVVYGGATDEFLVTTGGISVYRTLDGGLSWSTLNSTAALKTVVRAGGLYVAAGNGIFTSPSDFSSFTQRNSTTGFEDVTYTGSGFVAVGTSGKIYTSADGLSWTSRTSGVTDTLNRVFKTAGTTIVAIGNAGKILTSTDNGATWSNRSPGITNSLTSIDSDGTNLVVVGSAGKILTSNLTGVSWATASSSSTGDNSCVVYDGSAFYAFSTQYGVLKSTTGSTWSAVAGATTTRKYAAYGSGRWIMLSFGQDGYVATGTPELPRMLSFNSVNSSEKKGVVDSSSISFYSVTNGSGRFVGASADNGTTFLDRSVLYDTVNLATTVSIAKNNSGRLVALGVDNTSHRYSDNNGATWTFIPTAAASGSDVIWTGTSFISVGNTGGVGQVRRSTDGATWTNLGEPVSGVGSLKVVYSHSGVVIAVSTTGKIIRSTNDGVTWTQVASGLTTGTTSLCGYNNNWIANTGGASVLISTDGGINWTTKSTPFTNSVFVIGDTFVKGSSFSTSTDGGNTWTTNSISGAGTVGNMVAYNSELYLIGGSATGFVITKVPIIVS